MRGAITQRSRNGSWLRSSRDIPDSRSRKVRKMPTARERKHPGEQRPQLEHVERAEPSSATAESCSHLDTGGPTHLHLFATLKAARLRQ